MTQQTLAGRIAVITGAGGLVGRGITLAFLRAGATVVAADLHSEAVEQTVDAARREGFDRVSATGGDVTAEPDVQAMVRHAVTLHGRLDIMVNNAAGPGAMMPFLQMTPDDFDQTVALTLRSVFLGIKHAGLQMRDQNNGGVILNTASATAHANGLGPDLYSVCKGAVVRLVQMAARELAANSIRVNSVSPGTVWGPGFEMLGWTAQSLADEHLLDQALLPSDIGEAMVWLASDAARLATGSDYIVDGGLTVTGSDLWQRTRGRAQALAERLRSGASD